MTYAVCSRCKLATLSTERLRLENPRALSVCCLADVEWRTSS